MADRSEQPQRTVPPQRRRIVVVPTPMPPLPRDPAARRRVIRQRGW
ncbi:hypothetical protein KVH15_37025 [Streptomyces olivaceus]|nr:hypothetical protein [Streptomyces olivaceus]MBZ6086575.1 hypothetical protein [Streptomyces olivaceus]